MQRPAPRNLLSHCFQNHIWGPNLQATSLQGTFQIQIKVVRVVKGPFLQGLECHGQRFQLDSKYRERPLEKAWKVREVCVSVMPRSLETGREGAQKRDPWEGQEETVWSINRWQAWAGFTPFSCQGYIGTEGHTMGAAMGRGQRALLQLDLIQLGNMGHWAFLDLNSFSHRWLERRGSLQRGQQALEVFHVLTF